jgi:hypothetical protein
MPCTYDGNKLEGRHYYHHMPCTYDGNKLEGRHYYHHMPCTYDGNKLEGRHLTDVVIHNMFNIFSMF